MAQTVDPATPAPGASWAPRWTPGPWAWSGFDLGDITGDLFGQGGKSVLASAAYEGMWLAAYDKDTDAANASLIAAAPDLAMAVQDVLGWIKHWQADMADGLMPTVASLDMAEQLCRAALLKPTEGAGG